jgi:predicted NUDIX family NTP pyrophosphohydrolase
MRQSAGLLLYRLSQPSRDVEVLIVHPGGPLFENRSEGVWSVPKGEFEEGEEPLAAAVREFVEELGRMPPESGFVDLGQVRQAGGKVVSCWAVQGDLDVEQVMSNLFEMEWPPRSGRTARFPEVDRAEWCSPEVARRLLNPAQAAFVDRLLARLSPPR